MRGVSVCESFGVSWVVSGEFEEGVLDVHVC